MGKFNSTKTHSFQSTSHPSPSDNICNDHLYCIYFSLDGNVECIPPWTIYTSSPYIFDSRIKEEEKEEEGFFLLFLGTSVFERNEMRLFLSFLFLSLSRLEKDIRGSFLGIMKRGGEKE